MSVRNVNMWYSMYQSKTVDPSQRQIIVSMFNLYNLSFAETEVDGQYALYSFIADFNVL